AREQVASEPVGPEQVQRASFRRADEMKTAFDQSPELVFVTEAEEAHRMHLLSVRRIDPAQRLHVELHGVAVYERPDEATLVEEMRLLGRCVDLLRVARVQVIRRDELAHQRGG